MLAASLNPTYEYGKRPSDSGPVELVSERFDEDS